MERIANFIIDHYLLIVFCMFLMIVPGLLYKRYKQKKAEKDPNNLAYYFKKYNLETYQDAWKVINNPNTPYEDRQKISILIEFYHKINESK